VVFQTKLIAQKGHITDDSDYTRRSALCESVTVDVVTKDGAY